MESKETLVLKAK
jgi:hypothetical protein